MPTPKKVYVYPNTPAQYEKGSNDYIPNLLDQLRRNFTIANPPTTIGLADLLRKVFSCDYIYFNWIEDLPHKRFGYLQVPLLYLIIVIAKLRGVKIIWFVHNNISHVQKALFSKKLIISLLRKSSDLILSHVPEINIDVSDKNFASFDHPLEKHEFSNNPIEADIDLLVWGSVSPYKGILEFVKHVSANPGLQHARILIAGKFNSAEYFEKTMARKSGNITIINKLIPESDLVDYFHNSRHVLFTYNSNSILSSAALCKSLSYGCNVIGPDKGSFKHLGRLGFVKTYTNLNEIDAEMLSVSAENENERLQKLSLYCSNTTWNKFGDFLYEKLNAL